MSLIPFQRDDSRGSPMTNDQFGHAEQISEQGQISASRTVREVRNLELHLGGEEHQGWLPPGAAPPLPTSGRIAVVDVRIEEDGHGYLLICESRNTDDS